MIDKLFSCPCCSAKYNNKRNFLKCSNCSRVICDYCYHDGYTCSKCEG